MIDKYPVYKNSKDFLKGIKKARRNDIIIFDEANILPPSIPKDIQTEVVIAMIIKAKRDVLFAINIKGATRQGMSTIGKWSWFKRD